MPPSPSIYLGLNDRNQLRLDAKLTIGGKQSLKGWWIRGAIRREVYLRVRSRGKRELTGETDSCSISPKKIRVRPLWGESHPAGSGSRMGCEQRSSKEPELETKGKEAEKDGRADAVDAHLIARHDGQQPCSLFVCGGCSLLQPDARLLVRW